MGLEGKTLDSRFRVDALVREGRLRVVFRGTDLETDQPVALTCLKLPGALDAAIAAPIADAFEAGCRLQRAMARASPHVPDVLACEPRAPDADPRVLGVSYVACAWLDGEPLSADLARRRADKRAGRSVEDTLDLLEGAARALSEAHSRGVAHFSVRPGAIFLAQGAAGLSSRMLEFGVARALDDADVAVQGPVPARARYEAPEQHHRILGEPGPWTDVYSLALVVLEVLSDRPVLSATDPLDPGRRPSPWTHGLRLSGPLERVIDRALVLDPKRRYPNASAFWAAARKAAASSKLFHLRAGVISARERTESGLSARLRSWGRDRRSSPGGEQVTTGSGPRRASSVAPAAVRKSSKPPTLGVSRPPQHAHVRDASVRANAGSRSPTDAPLAWSSAPIAIPPGPPLPRFGEEVERFQSEFPLGVGRGPFWSTVDSSVPPPEDLDEVERPSPMLESLAPLAPLGELAVPGSLHPPPVSSRSSSADALASSAKSPVADSSQELATEPGASERDDGHPADGQASPEAPRSSPPSPPSSPNVSARVLTSTTNAADVASSRKRRGLAFVGLLGAIALAAIAVSARSGPADLARAGALGPPRFDPLVAARALDRASTRLGQCARAEGPSGKAEAVIELGPDGHVTKVVLAAPFRGTPVGDCVGAELERADMGAFEGTPRMVVHSFEIAR